MMVGGDEVVPFSYVRHNSPFLRQGEIISDLFELKVQVPEGSAIELNQGVKLDRIEHPYAIVVSQDCDLTWDYEARAGRAKQDKLLTHILFCALFTQDEIKDRSKLTTEPWKRVRQNQDERYHYFVGAGVADTADTVPELIADFKTTFSVPVEFVNWLVSTRQVKREGALFSPYLEDFMHRLYSFLGRVATPEIEKG